MARRLAIGALATLALGAVLSAAQLQVADPAFAGGTPSCINRQLSRHLSAETHDATDRYRFIVLTNTGGRCILLGRPAVSLAFHGEAVGARGDYFPYSPTGGTPTVRPVTLGHRASAAIWLAVATARGARCHKQHIDGFLLQLPHQKAQQVQLPAGQRDRYTVCASRSSHELDFSQFLPGSRR